MPATTTLATLLSDLAEELDLGLVLDDSSATTTVITETTTGTSELRGPFTGLKIPVGSPVTVITGTAGEDSFVQSASPSAGTLTLLPAITTGSTKFIIWNPDVKHGKNIEKAISRAHQKCRRWQKVPLTFVPDGELLATTVTDYWTASAGTASYQTPTVHEFARVLQISHSSAANVQSNTIPVHAAEQWVFETSIRVTTDGDTATFSVQDITNTAEVTVSYSIGDGATTSREFQTLRGTFTVPGTADTDARIAFRLAVSGSGTMTAQMGPIVAYPVDARTFAFSNRVLGPERVGNFYYSYGYGGSGGPQEVSYTEPITIGGRTATFSNNGDHSVVTFNFTPCEPVYYDELIYGAALTSLTDTTVFDPGYVKLRSTSAIYRWLWRSDRRGGKRAESGVPLPSPWRDEANAAARAVIDYEINRIPFPTIVGRR